MADEHRSKSLVKRRAEEDMRLMPPPSLPKKIKRPGIVLDEDVYTDALSHIIARDFFPGLLQTEAQQEYINALDSNDAAWIREAARNLKEVVRSPYRTEQPRGAASGSYTPASAATTATPGRTPVRSGPDQTPFRTPLRASEDDHGDPVRPVRVDASLSLREFQAKYTSEDNASFNDVLDAQNVRRARKYAHLRNNTNNLPSKRLVIARAREQKLLQGSEPQELTLRPSQDLTLRPASIDSFKTRQGARNSFMFAPDGVEDELETVAERRQATSLAPPKQTVYSATRLPGPEAAKPLVPPSPSMSAVDAAIGGHPRLSQSEQGSINGDVYTGDETPMVNGYKFVDEQPTAAEQAMYERGVPVDDEEAMRQEREEAEKLLPKLDKDRGGAGFKFSAGSKREQLHLRMVEKNNEKARSKAAESAAGRAGGMTPAGKSLASRLGTPARSMDGGWFGGGGTRKGDDGKAWTPMSTSRVKR